MIRLTGWLRTMITGIALLAAFSITLAAGVQVAIIGLPESEAEARQRLDVFLSTGDVGGLSHARQLELAHLLEEDFRSGYDWRPRVLAMHERQRTRFLDNFVQLMRVWLADKVDGYFACPTSQRNNYLDAQIDNLLSWKVMQPEMLTEARSGGQGQLETLRELMHFANDELARAQPEERRRLAEFMRAAQLRYFARLW